MAEQRENRPNTEGFAGEGTGPEPVALTDDELAEAEAIAVPSGDITSALVGAIDELVEPKSGRDAEDDQDGGGSRR
jgi:hypothetical protein